MKEYPWQTIVGQAPSKSNAYKIVKVDGHLQLAKTDATKNYETGFF